MTPASAWQPAWRVFVRRTLINAALTLVIALALLFLLTQFWQATPMIAVYLAVIAAMAGLFEDIMRWRRVRAERWHVEMPHLIHDGPEGIAMIPLSEITQARTRFGGAVLLQLRSGQRVAVRYLDAPLNMITALNSARPA